MPQRGRSSAVRPDEECSDPPRGGGLGTVAQKLSNVWLNSEAGSTKILQVSALINELLSVVGTPAYLLVVIQFLQEIDCMRVWLRGPRTDHPHDYLPETPLRKEPIMRAFSLDGIRGNVSPTFQPHLDSFYDLLAALEDGCVSEGDGQCYRFLIEVNLVVDLIAYVLR